MANHLPKLLLKFTYYQSWETLNHENYFNKKQKPPKTSQTHTHTHSCAQNLLPGMVTELRLWRLTCAPQGFKIASFSPGSSPSEHSPAPRSTECQIFYQKAAHKCYDNLHGAELDLGHHLLWRPVDSPDRSGDCLFPLECSLELSTGPKVSVFGEASLAPLCLYNMFPGDLRTNTALLFS